jgi:mitochondrial fission protein ELM1
MSAVPASKAPRAVSLQSAEALSLECVTFGVASGVEPSSKPPVRIFLGTEEAQLRAERVFLYSINKLRDPARVYQIYLMKDLPGFDRRDWRTGFTLYRFAVPELAGGTGRAIYNDVDQIYLVDPAELFDIDLDGHGYRAVAANDTSVMVVDCAGMLPWWNLEAARHKSKRELLQGPASQPGRWGPLDAGWNARDLEYRAGESRLLHFTTLHLQPWRPTPEEYSYHPHPLAGLWLQLEREADQEGFQPFTRQQPSGAYRKLLAGQRNAEDLGNASREGVAAAGVLERLPAQDVPWFLEALFSQAQGALHLQLDLRQMEAPRDRPAPARVGHAAEWWRDRLAQAAERHASVAWQLELLGAGSARRRYRYVPPAGSPRVWVLLGRREGDNRQLLALAEALGWPYQAKKLAFKRRPLVPAWMQGASLLRLDRKHSAPLAAPWPDLVLACGRRSAPVARWIRRRSQGAARLVHLGRPRAPLSAFDLVVTTPQYRLPARSNVVHNLLPLNRAVARETQRAVASWASRMESLPRPRVALMVGGASATFLLNEETATRLREQAEALAKRSGGSLLIATSPRTPAAAARILLADSQVPGIRYGWRPGDTDNPYPLFLEAADEFIVTGDSASMIAEACMSGRPVHLFPLPPRRKRPRLRPVNLLLWLVERESGRRGERGTPRQQGRLQRWLDAFIAAGLLRPPRQLARLHDALRWSGLAQTLGEPQTVARAACTDLDRTVAEIRRLFLRGRAVGP